MGVIHTHNFVVGDIALSQNIRWFAIQADLIFFFPVLQNSRRAFLFSALVLTVIMALRERHAIDFGSLKWIFVGRIPGTLIGLATLALVPRDRITTVVAIMILVAVGLSLLNQSYRPKALALAGAGIASGFMGTTSSIGGPPDRLDFPAARRAQITGDTGCLFWRYQHDFTDWPALHRAVWQARGYGRRCFGAGRTGGFYSKPMVDAFSERRSNSHNHSCNCGHCRFCDFAEELVARTSLEELIRDSIFLSGTKVQEIQSLLPDLLQ